MWYQVAVGRWCKSTIHIHKSHIIPPSPSCPPSTELTYSHVALILVPLSTGSPSIPPSFHNIQAIQNPNIMNYPKSRKQGRGKELCPKHIPIPQLSLLKYPVTFSLFRFVNRWIDPKLLLEVPSTQVYILTVGIAQKMSIIKNTQHFLHKHNFLLHKI